MWEAFAAGCTLVTTALVTFKLVFKWWQKMQMDLLQAKQDEYEARAKAFSTERELFQQSVHQAVKEFTGLRLEVRQFRGELRMHMSEFQDLVRTFQEFKEDTEDRLSLIEGHGKTKEG